MSFGRSEIARLYMSEIELFCVLEFDTCRAAYNINFLHTNESQHTFRNRYIGCATNNKC